MAKMMKLGTTKNVPSNMVATHLVQGWVKVDENGKAIKQETDHYHLTDQAKDLINVLLSIDVDKDLKKVAVEKMAEYFEIENTENAVEDVQEKINEIKETIKFY